jgi:hypothetical protein
MMGTVASIASMQELTDNSFSCTEYRRLNLSELGAVFSHTNFFSHSWWEMYGGRGLESEERVLARGNPGGRDKGVSVGHPSSPTER